MIICVVYCSIGLAFLAMAMSLIQENIMLKTERMKRKMGLGKKKDIRIEEIKRRERYEKDSSGFFIIDTDVETARTLEEDDASVMEEELAPDTDMPEEEAEVEDLENEEEGDEGNEDDEEDGEEDEDDEDDDDDDDEDD